MKIAVLGANGRTGSHVVRIALERGMDVVAVVRSEDRTLSIQHDKLSVAIGDPCDVKFLSLAFRGQDAVISTLGGRTPTKAAASIYPRSAEAIVEAARDTGLKRVLVTSTALLFPARTLLEKIIPLIVRQAVRSAKQMESTLNNADLNWTLARCGFLTNTPETEYRAEIDRLPSNGSTVSRDGLAHFLVDAVDQPDAFCQIFGVSGPTKSKVAS